MVDNTIALRVQQLGAEGVKQRLREINDELRAGKPVTKELKTEMRELSTQANAQTKIVNIQRQAWAANHQTLLTVGRAMNVVGSIARSMLAVTTAFSVATLAFGKNNSQMIELQAEQARLQRELADAIASGDFEKMTQVSEQLNVVHAKIAETQKSMDQEKVTGWVNAIATGAIIIGQFASVLKLLGPQLSAARTAMAAFTVQSVALSPALSVAVTGTRAFSIALRGMFAAMGPIGWAILGLSIAIPLLIEHWPAITEAFQGFADFMVTTFGPALASAWEGIRGGFIAFANGMITIANMWINNQIKGIELLANGFIAVVNGMISAYNAVAGLLGLGKIGKIGNITLPAINIPLIAAAKGFDGMVSKPTMFLAGEAGPERVTVTPSGKSSSGGGGGTFVFNNYGTVTDEMIIRKFDRRFKNDLIDRGFTGY